ncbi:MAG: hypothetical protein WED33_04360 [Bacteroidia bacterium]
MIHEEFDFKDPKQLRQRAEEKLIKKQVNKSESTEEADLKKLLHELQVHQIELEMQNDELHIAYEKAEEALKKHTLLYDLAPIGFFIVDEESSIVELNFTAAAMLKERRFELINNNFRLFIMPESLPVFNRFFDRVFASGAKESCKLNLGYDGHLFGNVYVEGVMTGEDKKCLLTVVDISKFCD